MADQDPLEQFLRRAPMSEAQRAAAWDAVTSSTDTADLEQRLNGLSIPTSVKADLWDFKSGTVPPAVEKLAPEHPHARVARMVVDWLPSIGGLAGGLIGGAGGTVAGMGVGGVPGAVGGAALGGAAGEAGRQLINRATGREAPETPGKAAASVAILGGLQGAAEGVGGLATKAIGSVARATYRGYLKPSLAANTIKEAQQISDTALDEALPIARVGVERGRAIIGDLYKEVQSLIGPSQRTVDIKTVADRVRQFARTKYYKPGADLTDYESALSVADKIDAHPSLGIPKGVNPTAVRVRLANANQIKQALDDAVGEAQFGVTSGAKTSAEKAGRAAMNDEIATQMPAVRGLNARESRLIDATKAIMHAVEREANQYTLTGGKSALAGMAAGGNMALGGDPQQSVALGVALRLGMHPAVASRVAITAARTAKELGVGITSATRLAIAALNQTGEPQGGAQ
jgi:hypothetical protein